MTGPDDPDAGWGPWPDDDVDEPRPGEHGGSDRVERGVEALQAAARELIRAARAVLDVAEEVVEDPDAVVSAVGQFTNLARNVVRTDWGAATHRAEHAASEDPDRPDDDPDDVEHIHVD